jgi:peptide/nickel transport system permease protein
MKRTFYGRVIANLLRDPVSLAGFSIMISFVAIAVVVAVAGSYVEPYDPNKLDFSSILLPPSSLHLFGTDTYGRDLFSRILSATPTDALVTFVVIVSAVAIGFLGGWASYLGGLPDEIVMRLTDVFQAFPSLVLSLAIAVILGPGVTNAAIALIATWWPQYARLSRGEALRIKNYDFVKVARVSGVSSMRIFFKHIFPNSLATIISYATLDLGSVVLSYAGLSYFGLGAQPPRAEWGAEISAGQDYLLAAPWWAIVPGVVIIIVAIAFALFGDGIRDAFSREFA